MRITPVLVTTSFLLAAGVALTPAFAATVTWDTSSSAGFQSGSGTWGTDSFWTADGTTLAPWVPLDTAAFLGQSVAVTDTVSIGSALSVGGLNFGSATTSGAWTLNGSGALTLGADASFSVESGSTVVISAPLTLSGKVLTKTGTGTLRLNTPTLASPNIVVSAGVLELQKAGTNYSGGSILVKTGGELALRTSDTWGASGTTTAAAITLVGGTLSSNGFFNSLNNLTLNGGTLNANGGDAAAAASFQLGTVTVNQSSSIQQSGSNANINLSGANFKVAAGATLTSNASFQGTSDLTKSGTGDLVLTGASTYTGGTKLNAGGLYLGANGVLGTGVLNFTGVNPWLSSDSTTARTIGVGLALSNDVILGNATKNGLLTFTGSTLVLGARTVVTLSDVVFTSNVFGGTALQKMGPGSLTLAGDNPNFAGVLQLQGGKLVLDYSTKNVTKFAGSLTLGGGSLELAGGSFAQSATSTTLNGGVTLTRSSGTSTLALGAITRNAGGLLDIQSAGVATTTTSNNNGVLGGVLLNGALAANDGNGNIVAYTAFTDIPSQGGVIANAAATNVRITDVGNTTGGVTVGSGVTSINSLVNAASQASNVAIGATDTLRLGAAGTIISGPGLNISGGKLTAGGVDNATGTLQFVVNSGTSTVSSTITNNGTASINVVKSGDGTLVLTAPSTYRGVTYVQAGTLEVGSSSDGRFEVDSGATLRMAANYAGTSYSHPVLVKGSGVSATSGLQLKSGIYYSINELTLDNAPTTIRNYGGTAAAILYGFDIQLNQMIVNAAASGSVVDASVNIDMSDYGYAVLVNAGNSTSTGDITFNSLLTAGASGRLVKRGSGSLKLTGNSANTPLRILNIDNGRVILAGGDNRVGAIDFQFANDGKLVLGDAAGASAQKIGRVSISSVGNAIVGGNVANSALTFNMAEDGTFAGKLGGDATNENNLSVTKSGAGTLTLSGISTFTGGTTVTGGRLLVHGSVGSVDVAGGGTLGGNGSVGNTTVASGGTIAAGASVGLLNVGNLTLAGGSVMAWQLNDSSKSAGVGYDLVVAQAVDLSGLSSVNRATLDLMTLANPGDNVSGTPLVFDKALTQFFTLIKYGSLNLGSNSNVSDLFAVNLNGFVAQDGSALNIGDFSVINDAANSSLKLAYYSPVPEPSTYGLGLGFLSLAIVAVRRQRRKSAAQG